MNIESYYETKQIEVLKIVDDYIEPILNTFDPHKNNLLKLIVSGSKGSITNFIAMITACGQKLIDGKRPKQQFDYRRTNIYTRQFDIDPNTRGFVSSAYATGLTVKQFLFDAVSGRDGLVNKQMSTALGGTASRKSIKNLESIKIDLLRRASKDKSIVQFLYGGDGINPQKLERVQFPMVSCSLANFREMGQHKDYPSEYEILLSDRDKFRKLFMQLERTTDREPFSTSRLVPVNVERIISTATHSNPSLRTNTPNTGKPLSDLHKKVHDYCDNLQYIFSNEAYMRRRGWLPIQLKQATWLTAMLVRWHLRTNNLANMTNALLDNILMQVNVKYQKAIIDSGMAVGIVAAQCFSGPITQYLIDSHRRGGIGGTSKSSIEKYNQIMNAEDVSKMANPSMVIVPRDEIAHDEERVKTLAASLEMIKIRSCVKSVTIFYEPFGMPSHPDYSDDIEVIKRFNKLHPLLATPSKLSNWCIRLELIKTELILKSITMSMIITRLRDDKMAPHVIHSQENDERLIVRIYLRSAQGKVENTLKSVKSIKDYILDIDVHGINGIRNTTVRPLVRHKIGDDGSISQVKKYQITTIGTNLSDVMCHPDVNPYETFSDAAKEVTEILGIEAGRLEVINQLKIIGEGCNLHHLQLYADEMTSTGRVTAITSTGLKIRDGSSVLLRAGFANPIKVLEDAALNDMTDNVSGLTASLLTGTIPKYGTLYSETVVDTDFIIKNTKSAQSIAEDILA